MVERDATEPLYLSPGVPEADKNAAVLFERRPSLASSLQPGQARDWTLAARE